MYFHLPLMVISYEKLEYLEKNPDDQFCEQMSFEKIWAHFRHCSCDKLAFNHCTTSSLFFCIVGLFRRTIVLMTWDISITNTLCRMIKLVDTEGLEIPWSYSPCSKINNHPVPATNIKHMKIREIISILLRRIWFMLGQSVTPPPTLSLSLCCLICSCLCISSLCFSFKPLPVNE